MRLELEDELLKKDAKPTNLCGKKYFDKLMKFLESPSVEVVRHTWNFLTLLSPQPAIQDKISKILEPTFLMDSLTAWKAYFDLESSTQAAENAPPIKSTNFPRTAYTFYLLSKFIHDNGSEGEVKKFKEQLKKNEGFGFLQETYQKLFLEEKSFIKNKCLIYCVKIIGTLMDVAYIEKYINVPSDQEKMWDGMNALIKLVCEDEETMDGKGRIEESEKAEILQVCFNIHKVFLTANKNATPNIFIFKILSKEYLVMFTYGMSNQLKKKIN